MTEDDRAQNHQASIQDYKNIAPYDKGHLFPNGHANSIDDQKSTFTLTNVVPQVKTFNGGSWKRMEECIQCVMDKYCLNQNNKHEAFVVAGAIPSANAQLNNKVNIPKTLWTAFCCYSNVEKKWLASAHWGDNDNEDPKAMKLMTTKTLADLMSHVNVEPFKNKNCPRASTVSQYYTGVERKCNCPLPPTPMLTQTQTQTPTQTPTPLPLAQAVTVGKSVGRRMASLLSCAYERFSNVCRKIYHKIGG